MHIGGVVGPDELWTQWSAAPAIAIPLAATAVLYARGVRDAWRRAGRGRAIPRWRVACFAGGLATLALALLSPLDAASEALFSAHMIQHLLLIQIAAPLLVLGAPPHAMLRALPLGARRSLVRRWRALPLVRRAWHAVSTPAAATALHAVALWLWHARTFYDAALGNPWVHAAEHASFLGTGLLLWWSILHARAPRRAAYATGIFVLFATTLQSGALGALLTFARAPWYPAHAAGAAAWGITPLDDQQLAGLIMWVPGGLLYVAGAAALFVGWMGRGREAEGEVGALRGTGGAWRVARGAIAEAGDA